MISEKIVVIDDEPRVLRSIELGLEEYEIIAFSSGKEAVDYLQKPNDVSVVVLDIMMPEIDGISILKEVKKINSDIAVIIMTAFGSKDIAIQALRYHADDFIEKPFEMSALKEKIQVILKNKSYYDSESGNKSNYVERIKKFIERNYKNASLEYVASEMCLSPKYISRMFNEKSGLSFRDYKVEVKIKTAKDLLENTSFNINEISLKLGYQNPESFMRIFKRITKVTPMQYRKKFREKNQKV